MQRKVWLVGFALWSCTTVSIDEGDGLLGGLDGLTEGFRQGYVFPDACPDTDDLDECAVCCEGQGYSQAALVESDCGCQNTETDDTTCSPADDADACRDCCDANAYDGYFFLGSEMGGDCSCMRGTTEPDVQN